VHGLHLDSVMDDVIPEASPTPSSQVINEKASETAGLGLAKSATRHTLQSGRRSFVADGWRIRHNDYRIC
jgi:hypothetical protein